MMSFNVHEIHASYTRNTSTVIEWLVQNAKRCGYDATKPLNKRARDNLVPIASLIKAPRLKGKARKAAKEQAANSIPQQSNISSEEGFKDSETPYRVTLVALRLAAEAIAESRSPRILVPTGIVHAARRAVSMRRQCHEYYCTQVITKDDNINSKKTHEYFINHLEAILHLLEPLFESPSIESIASKQNNATSTNTSNTSPKQHIQASSNSFANLEVFEPTETTESIPSTPTKPVANMVYEIEPASSDEREQEARFEVSSLFMELDELRIVVKEMWREYAQGKTRLEACAMATDMANKYAIQRETELKKKFPMMEDYDTAVSATLLRPAEGRVNDSLHSEAFLRRERSLLERVCQTLQLENTATQRPFDYGEFKRTADTSKMKPKERDHHDFCRLMHIMPSIFAMEYHTFTDSLAVDEFTLGIQKMARTGRVPIWLVSAVATFIDVHEVLRGQGHRPFIDLTELGCRLLISLKDYQVGKHMPNNPKEQKAGVYLEQVIAHIEQTILTDRLYTTSKALWEPEASHDLPEYLPLVHYRFNPVFCGVTAFQLLAEYHHYGVSLVVRTGTISFATHLYNLLKHIETSLTAWQLAEQAINVHGPEVLFFGGLPKDRKECYNKTLLLCGVSATSFAANQRTRGLKVLPQARILKGDAELRNILSNNRPKDFRGDVLPKIEFT